MGCKSWACAEVREALRGGRGEGRGWAGSGERRAKPPSRLALGGPAPLDLTHPFPHPAPPPAPPSATPPATLPPEIEAVLRAAIVDQAALARASRRSGAAAALDEPASGLTPAQQAALASLAPAGGGHPGTGTAAAATPGLRPARSRHLSTQEMAGLTCGLVFVTGFCAALVLLASRKEKYGRYFCREMCAENCMPKRQR